MIIGLIAIIAMLIGTSISIYFLNQDDLVDNTPKFTDVETKTYDYKGNFSATIAFNSTNFYKGENLNFSLSMQIADSPIFLHNVQLTVYESKSNRSASQSVQVNQTFQPGSYLLNLTVTPGFDEEGFLVLTNKNYSISSFNIKYMQRRMDLVYSQPSNVNIQGLLKPEFDQTKAIYWNITNEVNSTSIADKGSIIINSTEITGSVLMNTTIQTTGYTRLYYKVSGLNHSTVLLMINNNINNTLTSADNSYIPIGTLEGFHNLSISVLIREHENITLNLSLPTRHIPILAVIASNHWTSSGTDEPGYHPIEYYIDQVSLRYEKAINVSIIPVSIFNFESNTTSDLYELADDAIQSVGKAYNLPNNTWTIGTGSQKENMGADILIILTNKTMDHLGIVLGSAGNAFNMAINARGSLFQGNFRLPSMYADNLIQHELAHVFGAPDRWTYQDPASIMSKSRSEDAFNDFIKGEYWLMRIDWLEEDIQTMYVRTPLYT